MFNSYQFQDVYKKLGINTNDLGCVMLDVSGLEKAITCFSPSDFYSSSELSWIKGFVANPGHLTLLYGLLDWSNDYQDYITRVLKGWNLKDLEIEKFDKFDSPNNDKYYCVIAKMKLTDDLLEAHQRLSLLPHINTFPTYTPHITIAYIKKDERILQGVLKHLNAEKFTIKPVEIWADNNSGDKLKIGLLK